MGNGLAGGFGIRVGIVARETAERGLARRARTLPHGPERPDHSSPRRRGLRLALARPAVGARDPSISTASPIPTGSGRSRTTRRSAPTWSAATTGVARMLRHYMDLGTTHVHPRRSALRRGSRPHRGRLRQGTGDGHDMISRLQDYLTRSAERDAGAGALVMGDERMSYGELEADTNRWARLMQEFGCGSGDRVCVLASKIPAHGRQPSRRPQGRRGVRARRQREPRRARGAHLRLGGAQPGPHRRVGDSARRRADRRRCAVPAAHPNRIGRRPADRRSLRHPVLLVRRHAVVGRPRFRTGAAPRISPTFSSPRVRPARRRV